MIREVARREEQHEYDNLIDNYFEELEYTVDDLIYFLNRINSRSITIQSEERDGETYVIGPVQELVDLMASHCLLDGRYINYWTKTLLEIKGYEIIPIKTSKFGWILGGIRTKVGIIEFS